MPWQRVIEIGTASGIVGTTLVWIGSKLFVTKKEKKDMEKICLTNRTDCHTKLCGKLDKISNQIDTNKKESDSHRGAMEEKLAKRVLENRDMVLLNYAEVSGKLGTIQGQLIGIEKQIDGRK